MEEVDLKNKCEICENYFTTKANLKKHIDFAHNEGKIHRTKNYKCDLAQILDQRNETVHEGKKDHKCDLCDKSFSDRRNLATHVYTVHEKHRDHKCNYCGKTFLRPHHLTKD